MANKSEPIISIYGRRGCGKTTRAKELLQGERRVVVYDAMREYDLPGYRHAATFEELRALMRKGWAKGFKLTFRPAGAHALGVRYLHHLARFLMRCQVNYYEGRDTKTLCLVVEEMSRCVPVQGMPPALSGFLELCNLGRHYGIKIIGISQRPAQVHNDFRGNCAERYFFGLEEHTDVTTVCKMIGPENKARLQSLPVHHYLKLASGQLTPGKNRLG